MTARRALAGITPGAAPPPGGWSEWGVVWGPNNPSGAENHPADVQLTQDDIPNTAYPTVLTNPNGDSVTGGWSNGVQASQVGGTGRRAEGWWRYPASQNAQWVFDVGAGTYDISCSLRKGHTGYDSTFSISIDGGPFDQFQFTNDLGSGAIQRHNANGVVTGNLDGWDSNELDNMIRVTCTASIGFEWAIEVQGGSWNGICCMRFRRIVT